MARDDVSLGDTLCSLPPAGFLLPHHIGLSSGLKLASIVLLFFAQFLWGRADAPWWKGAAALTILTDYLLLFSENYGVGIFLFIFVHYFRYLQRMTDNRRFHPLILALGTLGLYLALQFVIPQFIALSVTYAGLLLLNTGEAWHARDGKLALAYLLFCACDLSVGMANIYEPSQLAEVFRKLIWIFYLPSQVLMVDHIIPKSLD